MSESDLREIFSRSSPVGVNPKPENCVFVPIPCDLRFNEAERSGRMFLPFRPFLYCD